MNINEAALNTFSGHGPYVYDTLKSHAVTILKNSHSGNYILHLTDHQHGPLIIDKDLESAKKKFIEAFGVGLIFDSVFKLSTNDLHVDTKINEDQISISVTHNYAGTEYNKYKDYIISEATDRLKKISTELSEL